MRYREDLLAAAENCRRVGCHGQATSIEREAAFAPSRHREDAESIARGRRMERAEIVAWLRTFEPDGQRTTRENIRGCADIIEAGEHRWRP